MTSWKTEIMVDGEWMSNGLRFATEEEAENAGWRELRSRWFVPPASRSVESDDPVTHRFVNGRRESIPKATR